MGFTKETGAMGLDNTFLIMCNNFNLVYCSYGELIMAQVIKLASSHSGALTLPGHCTEKGLGYPCHQDCTPPTLYLTFSFYPFP